MFVLLNPYCNYNTGRARWEKIKDEIQKNLGSFETYEINSQDELLPRVSKAVRDGEQNFIAAGGDGTVNILLNTLLKTGDNPNITIGAIGLGSSNDFHKPFRKDSFIGKTPLKIDFKNASYRDVVRIEYKDENENADTKYFLNNAGIGLTSEGNAFFNKRNKLILLLQRISVDTAIAAVALKTIFSYKNFSCDISLNGGQPEKILLTNIGIIKNPHFTGTLCYDTPFEPDSGKFHINVCQDMNIAERIGFLFDLMKHRFSGRPKRSSRDAESFFIKSGQAFTLEFDGEIVNAKEANFSVITKKMRCCN